MLMIASRLYFVAISVILFVSSPLKTRGNPNYAIHSCSNDTIYSSNSTYEDNLNTLLSVLSSNSTNNINGFYNFTAGDNPPDKAYGLFLCRGDISPEVCHDCVATATGELVKLCPNQKEANVWYEECMLRYSNQPIFSILDSTGGGSWCSDSKVSDPTRSFREVLGNVIVEIATDASNGQSGKKYAIRRDNYPPNQTLYGLAQCTPDLTPKECKTCLLSAIPFICNGNQGWKALSRSCYFRYESVPFYNMTAIPPPKQPPRGRGVKQRTKISIAVTISAFLVLVLLCGYVYYQERRRGTDQENQEDHLLQLPGRSSEGEPNEDHNFPSFEFDIISSATNQFSNENKIGEGGFGPVYKGVLPDGKAIAVKRLSRASAQGLEEFRNEISLIARLQHRNLVCLLGCCLEVNELLLIYEYMPNISLDFFLFDSDKGAELDWTRRLVIIKGIARGILYLHEDSRLRIIHRDLKASNVLLDQEMNPKICDFGLAKIFGMNQDEGNTTRIVGTFGYMAPEYAMEGLFSVKSDVFSFGVLLLEIISGKKNNGFCVHEQGHSLLSFAWELWSQDNGLELLDPVMKESSVADQVLKCIHIGLLCVQDDPADRPTMSFVVVMMSTDSVTLPQPTKPVGRQVLNSPGSFSNVVMVSENETTVSTVSRG